MKRSLLIAVLVILLIIVIAVNFHLRANNNNFFQTINKTPQNALNFVDPTRANQPLIPADAQQQQVKNYLEHYFTPWLDQPTHSPSLIEPILTTDAVKKAELDRIDQFTKEPGWGINRHQHDQNWMIGIANNMNLGTFPNHLQKAITLHDADVRVLPTEEPSFDDWKKAGEGYPFDYVQQSLVPANTPILILQSTQDGAWDLILTHTDLGWMKTQDIANVDAKFIHAWQTGNYLAITKDKVSIVDTQGHFRFMANIGAVFPLEKSQNAANNFKILVAVADVDQNAVIRTAEINKTVATVLPLAATPRNIATIANNLLGVKYGWGGILGYRDCSSTMKDLFTPFGIWLPRNTDDQIKVGSFTDLKTLSAKQKTQKIVTQGVPFLTLLHLRGHIVLYIGQHNGKAYIFHDFWGVHTKSFFGQKGRAIVGETAITTLNLGEGYINVPKRYIDLVHGMTILDGKN